LVEKLECAAQNIENISRLIILIADDSHFCRISYYLMSFLKHTWNYHADFFRIIGNHVVGGIMRGTVIQNAGIHTQGRKSEQRQQSR
jgi:hypothetical protein